MITKFKEKEEFILKKCNNEECTVLFKSFLFLFRTHKALISTSGMAWEVCMGLHEKTEGSEAAYIHRRWLAKEGTIPHKTHPTRLWKWWISSTFGSRLLIDAGVPKTPALPLPPCFHSLGLGLEEDLVNTAGLGEGPKFQPYNYHDDGIYGRVNEVSEEFPRSWHAL